MTEVERRGVPAVILAASGFVKDARQSARNFGLGGVAIAAKAFLAAHPELQWLLDRPETVMPVLETPDCFGIAVVGGQAGRGAYLFGCGEPVTRVIEE